MVDFIAVFCSGVFFGVALCITWVQHPAALEIGPAFAGRLFSPMYRRAAPLQIALAALGTLSGLGAWWRGSGGLWLPGALLLFAVIPFTLVFMMPVNNQLLAPGRDSEALDTEPSFVGGGTYTRCAPLSAASPSWFNWPRSLLGSRAGGLGRHDSW
jgi:hypothetical protein